jgi:hypothetical protein
MFTLKDVDNYVGRREEFIGNSGPQNEAKNVTEDADAFKMFFTLELIEIIVRKTNTHAEQCLKSRGITLPLQSRMRDWKPASENEIYDVLVFIMLMGIAQRPTLQLYLKKRSLRDEKMLHETVLLLYPHCCYLCTLSV